MASKLNKITKIKSVQLNNFYRVIFSRQHHCSSGNLIKENVLYSDVPDIEIPFTTVPELIFSSVDKYPDLIALECAVTGRKYTFAETRQKAKNLGKSLKKKLKLKSGDVVALLLPNVPEYAIATLGTLEAGGVVTTLNPAYNPEEISRQLADSSAQIIITLDELHTKATDSLKLLKKQIPVICIHGTSGSSTPTGSINFAEFTDNQVDFTDTTYSDPNSVAFMPYSSGTTGLPKGVELTHLNIIANLCQVSHPKIKICRDTNGHQDVVPAVLPHFHIYGLVVNLLHILHCGAKTVTLPKFTPQLYLNTLKKYKPDVLFLVPPIILFLASNPAVKSEDVASVRTMISGAAPLGALDEQRMIDKSNGKVEIYQGYGLTETSPVISMSNHRLKGLKLSSGSVGRLMPNTRIKIVNVDDPDKILKVNEAGELLVQGPQVMKGYHNRPKENQSTFHDGWLRTGDLFSYNEDGLLFIKDRLKELIKVKGFQVPPAELEEVIRDHPDVLDVAVIGIPHPKYGEAPRAYVVPKQHSKLDGPAVQEYVSSKVADYKRLFGGVCLVEAIPKNASGKILRRDLRLQYEAENKASK